jgi:hypothetical protein
VYAQNISKRSPEEQRIEDIIDIELITQQIKSQALDYKDCEKLMDSIMEVSGSVRVSQ